MDRDGRNPPGAATFKHWTAAGLLLTDWCSARCASCYLRCSPAGARHMPVERALGVWRSLIEASPSGCKVHLSGGEPFGDWDRLAELCRRAHEEHLGPLAKVETNASWATDDAVVRERLRFLDACGMGKLTISADPYHQQYVPIERPRRAARVAEEVLGSARVQVRWRDWLADGHDTSPLPPQQRQELFAQYDALRRDRHNGRSAEELAPLTLGKPVESFADSSCAGALLRSKHVHVDPDGWIVPGVCAGIVLGQWGARSVGEIWWQMAGDHAARAIVGRLIAAGPTALLPEALDHGFKPLAGYADKCHVCWSIRRHWAAMGVHADELGPTALYGV